MDQDAQASNALKHLARLSDFIFALAMALTFWQFDLPENAEMLAKVEINQFLVGQLKPLGAYLVTFVLVAMYWIAHTQQFSYYKRTNETHLWIYTLYLMCLFLVPYSNELSLVFPSNSITKICFAVNISLIGFLSFASWNYATYQHHLVDENLDAQTIATMKIKALIEPICAMVAIAIALFAPAWSDLAWLLFLPVYFTLKKLLVIPQEANQATRSSQ
ncbi:TMEM175 family protein [Leptolyngbya sp. FACHB-261]|uniref:TMEM175 family protein n=1 Tax=Leptolyngbya sp. FACHB-261 TaxID=2692806 RepID=UPI001688D5F0|nr:TMEM175 family protein [Leptolyngbya sp. FACHB-261]MBD2099991.1 DUF1211 domain-containing protein [Leptolyngbya sp. FACHB-261]